MFDESFYKHQFAQVGLRYTNLNEVNDIQFSGFLDLYSPIPATTISATLPGAVVPTANTTVLQCIGIEFYQQVGPNYYLFSSGSCLKVEDAF